MRLPQHWCGRWFMECFTTHEHLQDRCSLSALHLPAPSCQQMVHGVFALMNICQIAVLSTLRLLQHWSCRQMVHGVFALMNICLIAVLFALRLLQRKSCQQMVHGVCTHEHLPDRCFFLCACYCRSCQQMVHGVFAFSTSDTSAVLSSALATAHRSCRQMVHGCLHS
jgi:hypothetical protein